MAGLDFSNPETKRALIFFLAGLGRTIGQGQGVAESLGAGTQNLIKAQNFQNLIKTLSGETATPSATATPTPKTTGATTGEGGIGKAIPSKITFEGSQLSDIGKILSGINIQEETLAPASAPNFLLPR